MSTLWASGDMWLKIDLGETKRRKELFNLIQKKFTKPHHPLQGKIRKFSIFLQFCFISGEQMSTLRANGDMGLKIELGATK